MPARHEGNRRYRHGSDQNHEIPHRHRSTTPESRLRGNDEDACLAPSVSVVLVRVGALRLRSLATPPRPHGLPHLPDPVPQRRPVRLAALPRRVGPHADLRDHGSHQSRARQLLHARRLSRVRPSRRSSSTGTWVEASSRRCSSAWPWRSPSAICSSGCSSATSIEREHLQQVLMTYGLILVFEEVRSMIVGRQRARRRHSRLGSRAASRCRTS